MLKLWRPAVLYERVMLGQRTLIQTYQQKLLMVKRKVLRRHEQTDGSWRIPSTRWKDNMGEGSKEMVVEKHKAHGRKEALACVGLKQQIRGKKTIPKPLTYFSIVVSQSSKQICRMFSDQTIVCVYGIHISTKSTCELIEEKHVHHTNNKITQQDHINIIYLVCLHTQIIAVNIRS